MNCLTADLLIVRYVAKIECSTLNYETEAPKALSGSIFAASHFCLMPPGTRSGDHDGEGIVGLLLPFALDVLATDGDHVVLQITK
jgi:hypothetical protein